MQRIPPDALALTLAGPGTLVRALHKPQRVYCAAKRSCYACAIVRLHCTHFMHVQAIVTLPNISCITLHAFHA